MRRFLKGNILSANLLLSVVVVVCCCLLLSVVEPSQTRKAGFAGNDTYFSNFDDSSILLRGVAFSEILPPPSRLKSNISRTPSGCRSKSVTYLSDFDDSSILLRGVAFSENFEKCGDF